MTDVAHQLIAQSGQIGGYEVFLRGDTVMVLDDEGIVTRQTVAGLGAFIAKMTRASSRWRTRSTYCAATRRWRAGAYRASGRS